MKTTWIVIANSSTARLFANEGPTTGLKLVKEFSHPESREKASDLVSDRPGHNQSAGGGHGSFVAATTPKKKEADRFALELAKELDQGRSTNRFEQLILVASSPFLGDLNGHLTSHVRNTVKESIDKDYTRASDRELAGHLEQYIRL